MGLPPGTFLYRSMECPFGFQAQPKNLLFSFYGGLNLSLLYVQPIFIYLTHLLFPVFSLVIVQNLHYAYFFNATLKLIEAGMAKKKVMAMGLILTGAIA